MLFRGDSGRSKTFEVLGIFVAPQVARWFAGLWICAVIVGSLLPGSARVQLHTHTSEDRPSHGHSTSAVSMQHRFLHFFAFGSSFFWLSLLATGKRKEVEVAAEIMAIGCVVELTQYFLYPYRHVFEWWDVRDDAIGIAVAFLAIQLSHQIELCRRYRVVSPPAQRERE
jgi:hypothetical protein